MAQKFGEITPLPNPADTDTLFEQNELRLGFLGRTSLEHGLEWNTSALTVAQAEECFDHLQLLHQHIDANVGRLFRARRRIAGTAELFEAIREGGDLISVQEKMEYATNTYFSNKLRALQRVMGVALADYCERNDYEIPQPANSHVDTLVEKGVLYRDALIGVYYGMGNSESLTIQAFNTEPRTLSRIVFASVPILREAFGPEDPVATRLADRRRERTARSPKKQPRPQKLSSVAPAGNFGPEFMATRPALCGREPLLKAEEEVELAKTIEVGVLSTKILTGIEEGSLSPELQEIVDRKGLTTKELETLEKQGKAAFQRFLLANTGLVYSMILRSGNRFKSAKLSFDDEAREEIFTDILCDDKMGLWHAIQKFDFALGNKFSTYAHEWIKKSITHAIKNRLLINATQEDLDGALQFTKNNFLISLNAETSIADGNLQSNESWIAAPDRPKTQPGVFQKLNEIFQKLEPNELKVIMAIHFRNLNVRETARELKMSRPKIERLYDMARLKINDIQEMAKA